MPDQSLFRLSAVAGSLSAVILLINVLRRAGWVPTNGITHAVAPLASVLALFAVSGLYLWQRTLTARLGLIGYALSTAGFAGAAATEVSVHFVFAHLPTTQVDRLVAGPSRPAFVTIAAVFTLGAVLFGAAMFRAGQVPRTAAAGYAACLAVFAWRNALPEFVVTLDGVLSATVVLWLSAIMWRAFVNVPDRPVARSARPQRS